VGAERPRGTRAPEVTRQRKWAHDAADLTGDRMPETRSAAPWWRGSSGKQSYFFLAFAGAFLAAGFFAAAAAFAGAFFAGAAALAAAAAFFLTGAFFTAAFAGFAAFAFVAVLFAIFAISVFSVVPESFETLSP
jgi:hypothetical protein